MDDIVWYFECAYALLIPVWCVYIYFHTDYTRIHASTLVKIESTIVLAFLWPICLMYVIKQAMLRKRNSQCKETDEKHTN